MSLVGRLGMYFVHRGRGQMVFELEGRGRLWRMFASFEMLEIKLVNSYGINIRKKRTLMKRLKTWRATVRRGCCY